MKVDFRNSLVLKKIPSNKIIREEKKYKKCNKNTDIPYVLAFLYTY